MLDIQLSPIVQVTLGAAFVAVVTAIGLYVLGRIRASSLQKEPPTIELLQNFRELHSQGVLDDDEYRQIKRQLSEKAVAQLRPTPPEPVFREASEPEESGD